MSMIKYVCPKCLTLYQQPLEEEVYSGETFTYLREECEECGREIDITITVNVEVE